MAVYKGKSINIESELLARVDTFHKDSKGISYLLNTLKENEEIYIRCGYIQSDIYRIRAWNSQNSIELKIGDIVTIHPDGRLVIAYESESSENAFLLTENCNQNCIMCPQAPKNKPTIYYDEVMDIIKLIDKSPQAIGITGGEPILFFDKFLDVIKTIRTLHPETHIQILTNGTLINKPEQVEKLLWLCQDYATFCIPLYSSISSVHDVLVGKEGAFWKAVNAINLLSFGRAHIEIRTVINKLNYLNLTDWAHFISMNIPCVQHVAIMGIEIIGKAKDNMEQLLVEPWKYSTILEKTVRLFKRHSIPVSIFNHPCCTLPDNLRLYAVKSISPWKVRFLPSCDKCTDRNTCGGVFFSNIKYFNNNLCNTLIDGGLYNE
ncbi:His-Xaa-Ser system radical SAM maturase HxsC [Geovibrio sp. ADMFC3]